MNNGSKMKHKREPKIVNDTRYKNETKRNKTNVLPHL